MSRHNKDSHNRKTKIKNEVRKMKMQSSFVTVSTTSATRRYSRRRTSTRRTSRCSWWSSVTTTRFPSWKATSPRAPRMPPRSTTTCCRMERELQTDFRAQLWWPTWQVFLKTKSMCSLTLSASKTSGPGSSVLACKDHRSTPKEHSRMKTAHH